MPGIAPPAQRLPKNAREIHDDDRGGRSQQPGVPFKKGQSGELEGRLRPPQPPVHSAFADLVPQPRKQDKVREDQKYKAHGRPGLRVDRSARPVIAETQADVQPSPDVSWRRDEGVASPKHSLRHRAFSV